VCGKGRESQRERREEKNSSEKTLALKGRVGFREKDFGQPNEKECGLEREEGEEDSNMPTAKVMDSEREMDRREQGVRREGEGSSGEEQALPAQQHMQHGFLSSKTDFNAEVIERTDESS
jgi:hypothetical protein